MAKLHKHMIVHAEVNRPPVKADEAMVEEWLTSIVHKMGMEVLREASAAYCEQVGNRGMTADVLITTSHMMIHTWDECEKPFIEFDVYTCSELDPQMVLDAIQVWEPTNVSYKFLDRYNGLTDLGGENVKVIEEPEAKVGRTIGDAAVEIIRENGFGIFLLLAMLIAQF